MLAIDHVFALSAGGEDAFVASPALHGAGGPLDEIISLGVFVIILGAVIALTIWQGNRDRRK